MRLLGKSYTLEDAAFYGAGLLAAMAAGASPATAKVGQARPLPALSQHANCQLPAFAAGARSLA